MPEQQLHCTQVLRPSIDQGRLGPSHRVRPVVRAVEAQLSDPVAENPGLLPRSQVWRLMEPAWEEEVIRPQSSLLDPRRQNLSGGRRDLELHWTLRLVLQHDGACGNLLTVAHVADLQGNDVTTA